MSMLSNHITGLAVCFVIAVATIWVDRSLWHLGGTYWLVLVLLALVHIVVSGIVFIANPDRLAIRLGVVVLLIIGQWWLIQMLVMQIIWRLRGFGP